ncbi:MAG TPA: HlyD family efflux transporter periplasmic adaptor subunit [Flavisolibacter sp.]|nr:HlyD family efflux transporter periplasmic adaptor subunit [Flavisolibacter sp.]
MENFSEKQRLRASHLVSEALQDVVSREPHWVLRRGNTIFLVVIVLMLMLTWFIPYADTLDGSSRLAALQSPKLVTAMREGRLARLFVANEAQVKSGQHLGYVEGTASYSDVMTLYRWLCSGAVSDSQAVFPSLDLPRLSGLGELQASYQDLHSAYAALGQIRHGYYQHRKTVLQKDLDQLAIMRNSQLAQRELLRENRALQEKEYKAYEMLERDKVIAPLELSQYKAKLNAREETIRQLEVQLAQGEVAGLSKKREQMELEREVRERLQAFRSVWMSVKAETESWIHEYVLISPLDGRLVYLNPLQEHEWVGRGQQLFVVEPPFSGYYAELMMPQKGLGKLDTGQAVRLRLESFPSDEYGYLSGRVRHISLIPNRHDSFAVHVDLPGGLVTHTGKRLFFRNGLLARAEVVTGRQRLFLRLIAPLRK